MIDARFQQELCAQYPECGRCVSVEVLAGGHINDTYVARYDVSGGVRSLVHQRINHNVFRNIPYVMENIVRVTEHARVWFSKNGVVDVERRVQTVYPTRDGNYYWQDSTGNYWRTQDYIANAYSRVIPESSDDAYEAAFAFGMFQRVVADLDKPRLHETIPGFHHTPQRFSVFEAAVAGDACDRLRGCQSEVEWLLDQKPWHALVQQAWDAGVLPERVVHNDAKVANVLFDCDTAEGLAVIDLDTVMPGLSIHDFGDLVRSTTCTAAEDEIDLTKVSVDVDLFSALAAGFINGAGALLTSEERSMLLSGAKTIILEQATRFLKDHLEGDTYFRVYRPNQNLDRARTQIQLLKSIQQNDLMLSLIINDVQQGAAS